MNLILNEQCHDMKINNDLKFFDNIDQNKKKHQTISKNEKNKIKQSYKMSINNLLRFNKMKKNYKIMT